jgi:hypothetical protein
MDQDALVADAQALTTRLDETVVKPKGVMWAMTPETDSGKLWVIPAQHMDKREFYGLVANSISVEGLNALDVGMVELVDIDRARRMGLGMFLTMPGIGRASMRSNAVNGVMLPDGIVIRMDI